jgi:hypothetical protein
MSRRLLLTLCACAIVSPALAACGGDSGKGTVAGVNTAAATSVCQPIKSDAAPTLAQPAGKYSVSIDDLGVSFITDIPGTFVLTLDSYSKVTIFDSPEAGKKLLADWGYLGGYETGYTPEGREVAVLNGAYRIHVESHLFKDGGGAKKAYDYFESRLSTAGSQKVSSASMANDSSAWQRVYGKVNNTSVNAVYHQYMFRRGNLVTILLTYGAEGFMKIDTACQLATIADAKALGQKSAVEPTPTANYTPPAGSR